MNPTDRFRALRAEGRSRDEALGELRRHGASPSSCIKALMEIELLGIVEAKRELTTSPSWADYVRDNDEALVRELEDWHEENDSK